MDDLYVKEAARQYTYADYADWKDDKRYELIDGKVYMLSAPSVVHQSISGELYRQLGNFLVGKPCDVFAAPFDVCLSAAGDDDRTVIQPDILVVCDKSKLDDKRCNGAPDMAIEILSPSTASRDMMIKYNKYMTAGVREYWIVNPVIKAVHVCILKDGEYAITDYFNAGSIPVSILEGCQINIDLVFTE